MDSDNNIDKKAEKTTSNEDHLTLDQDKPEEDKDRVRSNYFLYELFNLENKFLFFTWAIIRVLECLFLSRNYLYADEYW